MLARGSGIGPLLPVMGEAFSRRALYRHRQKHMNSADAPAARPVPFPHDGSALDRVRWLQREAEHTAAMAERQGSLSAKVKAIHELSRLIWLEQRLSQSPADDEVERQYREHVEGINLQTEPRLGEARERREASLASSDLADERSGSDTSW
jgi:hypothetical protein